MSNCGICTSGLSDFNNHCDYCRDGSHFREVHYCSCCGEVMIDDYYFDKNTEDKYCCEECLITGLGITIVVQD